MADKAMQHYLLTQIIQARPLKALDQEFDPCDGFQVSASDGFISFWTETADFESKTIALGELSHLSGWQQRLVAEKAQLDDKIKKLSLFILADSLKTLPLEDQRLLLEQDELMQRLSKVLMERIARFSANKEQSEHECCGKRKGQTTGA